MPTIVIANTKCMITVLEQNEIEIGMLTSLIVNEVDAIVTLTTMRMNATRPATGIDDSTNGIVGMMTANAATMIGTGSVIGIENVIVTIVVVTITTWIAVDMVIEPKGIAGAILDVATHEGRTIIWSRTCMAIVRAEEAHYTTVIWKQPLILIVQHTVSIHPGMVEEETLIDQGMRNVTINRKDRVMLVAPVEM